MISIRIIIQRCCIYIVLASLALTGCALPVPKMTSPQSTGLGIVLEQCLLLGCSSPAVVYFARLDTAGSLTNAKTIFKSNYLKGNRVFLLNAPPGIYAAVATQNSRLDLSDSPVEVENLERGDAVFLPRQVVEGTVTKISKGEFRYLGAYNVKIETGEPEKWDEVQKLYLTKLHRQQNPGSAATTAVMVLIELTSGLKTSVGTGRSDKYYCGEIMAEKPDNSEEAAFYREAGRDFEGSEWESAIENRSNQ